MGDNMDFTSTLQHETGRKFENGTVLDSTGNYIALIAYFCMYLTVLQVLLYTWEGLKPVAKTFKSSTLREDDEQQVDETNRIYHALEKYAKVSMSNNQL